MTTMVERDRFRQAILSAIADPEAIRILDCTTLRCKSINDVIRETSISHSTAYRKIKWMLDEGLLYTEKIDITPDGKKFSLIRSTLNSIDVSYAHGKIVVKIEYNANPLEKTTERLFSINPD